MRDLQLKLDNNSVELLANRTELTNQKIQVREEIQKITGLVDSSRFSQIPLSVDYVSQLNEMATQINGNEREQQLLTQQINAANQQIADLQQKSKTFSVGLIIAIVVIIIVIMIIR